MRSGESAREAKRRVGIAAAAMVQEGQVVGLGTGSTAAYMIEELGRRIREEGLSIRGVPTSYSSSLLARAQDIPVRTLDDVGEIDIAIDGADEVDPAKNLIKGGGGAHTREKIVASAARRFVIVVDDSKLVARLGERMPVPVEVIPMALRVAMRRLEALGGSPVVREGVRKDGPVVTDEGNLLVDVRFGVIEDAARLEREINDIPGVVDNGLFVGLASLVLVADSAGGGIRRIE